MVERAREKLVDQRDSELSEGQEERENKQKAKYRAVLCSPLGMEVFSDILLTLRFGSTIDPDNSLQVAQHNVAVSLLVKCGVFREDNYEEVIRALCSSVKIQREVEK